MPLLSWVLLDMGPISILQLVDPFATSGWQFNPLDCSHKGNHKKALELGDISMAKFWLLSFLFQNNCSNKNNKISIYKIRKEKLSEEYVTNFMIIIH